VKLHASTVTETSREVLQLVLRLLGCDLNRRAPVPDRLKGFVKPTYHREHIVICEILTWFCKQCWRPQAAAAFLVAVDAGWFLRTAPTLPPAFANSVDRKAKEAASRKKRIGVLHQQEWGKPAEREVDEDEFLSRVQMLLGGSAGRPRGDSNRVGSVLQRTQEWVARARKVLEEGRSRGQAREQEKKDAKEERNSQADARRQLLEKAAARQKEAIAALGKELEALQSEQAWSRSCTWSLREETALRLLDKAMIGVERPTWTKILEIFKKYNVIHPKRKGSALSKKWLEMETRSKRSREEDSDEA